MPRFKITCEYEGTRFSGWQVQKNARTVQGELIGASKSIFNTDAFELYGSGRTDAGVHALEQVFHLDVDTMLAPHIIQLKMNDALPADISIRNVQKVAKQFHARHDAIERTYVYQISTRRTAFGKRYVWWVKDQLSVQQMQEAAKHFKGMHDFRSFTADDPDMKSTKVEITDIKVNVQGDLLVITISGSHFLWNMIRRMIGILVEIGRGKQSPDIIPTLLKKKSDLPASFTAPPSGLFLASVRYENDPKKNIQTMLNVT
ncbi:MAG: tRNA pseudouridine synthase [Bacteroidota bacterium]|jgi:tRNA pseudouridine38-40 synthase